MIKELESVYTQGDTGNTLKQALSRLPTESRHNKRGLTYKELLTTQGITLIECGDKK